MKWQLKFMLVLGILTACFVLKSSFRSPSTEPDALLNDEIPKVEVSKLIDIKCHVGCLIQKPFMDLKNSNDLIEAKETFKMVFRLWEILTEIKLN